jgi:hypothetical protein
MKLKNNIFFSIIALLIASCGGSGSGSDDEPTIPEILSPAAASLIFPEDDTVCNISEILSETQSRVTFQWNASENTDSYELRVRNLNTGNVLTSTSNTTESPLIIQRGTPYEWSVISLANGTNETATSASFRFFNEGPGLENFAPFPAEAVLPIPGSTVSSSNSMTMLEWSASDIDGDINEFEIFLDTVNPPLESVGITQNTNIEINITTDQIYFWQIITRDGQGNASMSPIFQFRTP